MKPPNEGTSGTRCDYNERETRLADENEVRVAVDRAKTEMLCEANRKLAIAEGALRRFGVCMSCLYGLAYGEQGCTDCMNTGFEQGESPADIERAAVLSDLMVRLCVQGGALNRSQIIEVIEARKGV